MPPAATRPPTISVRDLAGAALRVADLDEKRSAVDAALASWRAGACTTEPPSSPVPVTQPGRPDRPELVHPRHLRSRPVHTAQGRAALVHAVAHIEANAVNLALDAVHRFDALPADYYGDWLRIAEDEARHFAMLRERLVELGLAYGDLPAHDGLWSMAVRTADDPLRRMALVPRVLEARGLDVTPGMIDRLRAAGDDRTADLLVVILDEEVAHVAAGTRWFRWLCAERGLDPDPTFTALLRDEGIRLVPPLNEAARTLAGFTEVELTAGSGGGAVGPAAQLGQN